MSFILDALRKSEHERQRQSGPALAEVMAGRVSFISNTRLICLRCHAQENHPMGVNHMVPPKGEVPEPFRLDGRGRVTCTTCHNPHIDAKEGDARSRRFVVAGEGSSLCPRCPRR